ncbi:MAG: efflux RND transporter permease subunit, partial [Candidatus Hydrogenedentota bacterium]
MKHVLGAFARNTIFANIVFVLILLAGGLAVSFMVREDLPEVSLDEIVISVAYPGADPEEVEEGISRKIEEAIDGTEGVKRYTTWSSENFSQTWAMVKEGYNASDVKDRIRSRVDSISTFPVDAEKPIITELMDQQPLMGLSLSGDMSERRLKEWAEKMKDDLRQFCKVSRVEIFGVREYEVSVEVSEERLREYGLTFAHVSDAIRRSNMNLMGGTIRTRGEEIRVRTVGRKYDAEKMSSIVVVARPQGEIITLARLATIRDGFTEDPISATVNGRPSVLLTVSKTPSEDALAISSAVRALVERRRLELPEGASIGILYDNSDALRSRINMLMKNGVVGLCLVFLLLWVFLDVRLSFWVGMGIPVSMAGALFVLWSIGG